MSENTAKHDLGYTALYLAFCGLKGLQPVLEIADQEKWQDIYNFSNDHSVAALVYESLARLLTAGVIEEKSFAPFKEVKQQSMIKNLAMEMEREELFRYMENEGIWYLPLKGIILEKLYPKQGLRQMCDNDILYDPTYRSHVQKWFVNRGYEALSVDEGKDDHYIKLPYASFEMHTALFDDWSQRIWVDYFRDIAERMCKDEDNAYGYHLSNEDFYLFLVTHAYKHYRYMGIGIRHLLDIYVFLNHYQLDWIYVYQELEKLKLTKFEEDFRRISEKAANMTSPLDTDIFSDYDKGLLAYIFSSGTYGDLENHGKIAKREDGVGKYVLDRLFPPENQLSIYPEIAKSTLALPLKWLWRWKIILSNNPDNVLEELRQLFQH